MAYFAIKYVIISMIIKTPSLVAQANTQNEQADKQGQTLFYFDSKSMLYGLLTHRMCYIVAVTTAEASTLGDPASLDIFEAQMLRLANERQYIKLTYGELLSKSASIAKICQAAYDFYNIDTYRHITTTPQPTLKTIPTTPTTVKSVTYPVDCSELFDSGTSASGVYTIYPFGNPPGEAVYCDIISGIGGWTLIQRRQDGKVSFYRNWNAYKKGFGLPSGEYWLGNDALHTMTNRKHYQLRIDMEDFENNRGYAIYDNFSIGDETSKYVLHAEGFSGDRGDSFALYSFHVRFSTVDQDNDNSPKDCVNITKGPWWYNECYGANLNGVYGAPDGDMTDISWSSWNVFHQYKKLKTTSMKIRPKLHI